MSSRVLLSCRDLHLSVRSDKGTVQILKGVDIDLHEGSVLGVAGESGSGKSTLVKTILGVLPRQASVDRGSVHLKGHDLLSSNAASREQRRTIGFIPQDPYLALNPQFTVGRQMAEILRWNDPDPRASGGRGRYRNHLVGMLKSVGLPDPEGSFDRYPHQFSGGQRQRILIATALACRPQILLADEPTTALDVTTQREILILLQSLVEAHGMSMLFVTHDFGVISQLCDEIAVMHSGKVVEAGATRQIIDHPKEEYTRNLMAAHPDRGGFDFKPEAAPAAGGA